MKLNNQDLFSFYKSKGITHLYHANTVRTSRTFIEQDGLLSRGAVQDKGLIQTFQSSDAKDQEYDVWNDIFLDTEDLHVKFNRQNYYGPVLFKISMDFIKDLDMEIWVTKDNPINWKPYMSMDQKYFISVEELAEKWNMFQTQRKMTTIKNTSQPSLFDYLKEIIVDNPKVKNNHTGLVYFTEAKKSLNQSVEINQSIFGKLYERECKNCYCRSNYLYQVLLPEHNRLFL